MLQLFKDMLAEGVEADHITFVSLLSACSHSGSVDEGQECFDIMQKEYGIEPSLKHYGCTLASERLLEVDSENVGYYVLLLNIYANTGKWEGVVKVRSLARDRGLRKTPGWSSVVAGTVQTASSLAISSRLLHVPFPKQTLLAADDGVEGVVPVPGSADTGEGGIALFILILICARLALKY
ncbi:hypothetical protein KIW84_055635 [Lathyrus oleraceus]|uniref:Pentatricopeptide repeat-containing protein n=1 Tax=Pisum sativum TaxID=3888 RepID=A0A9D4WW74_PEA|nr:hypothetical protein KIW84_055635 [Pisum sativum]